MMETRVYKSEAGDHAEFIFRLGKHFADMHGELLKTQQGSSERAALTSSLQELRDLIRCIVCR